MANANNTVTRWRERTEHRLWQITRGERVAVLGVRLADGAVTLHTEYRNS